MTSQARKLFRILAGLIALLGVHSLLENGASVIGGSYRHLSSLLVSLIFALEFGCIAIRGDGLWLYKAARFKKNKKTQNKKVDSISKG